MVDSATDRGSNPDSPSAEPLNESTIHNLLGNERRYRCLQRLAEDERSNPADVQALADELTAELAEQAENGSEVDDLRNSIYVSLSQTHLPKLDDKDIIEYHDTEQIVDQDDQFDRVRSYLDDEEDGEGSSRALVIALALSAVISALGLIWPVVGGAPVSVLVMGITGLTLAWFFGYNDAMPD